MAMNARVSHSRRPRSDISEDRNSPPQTSLNMPLFYDSSKGKHLDLLLGNGTFTNISAQNFFVNLIGVLELTFIPGWIIRWNDDGVGVLIQIDGNDY